MKKWILLSAIILVNGCSVKTIPVPVELTLPPAQVLPTIPSDALTCLADDAYGILVKRDKMQAARILTLENIIRSTQGDSN